MFLGSIGIITCFHEKGKRKDINATLACIKRALYLDIRSTFFSNSNAIKISITCSAFKALNRYSISAFVAYGGY
jgi:hypothetical protein